MPTRQVSPGAGSVLASVGAAQGPGATAVGGANGWGSFAAMSWWRTAVVSVVVVSGAAALAACSSSSGSTATPSDPVLAEGQQIFNARCATCHGRTGNGGMGPKLAGVVAQRYPNIADQEAVIANGRSSMPSFAKQGLTPEQIEAVARYTRESLGS